jgi:hypothetical protein
MRRQVFHTTHGVFYEHRTSHPDQGGGSFGDDAAAPAPPLPALALRTRLPDGQPLPEKQDSSQDRHHGPQTPHCAHWRRLPPGDFQFDDAIFMGHYPKSGHVANRMGHSVALYIAQQSKGQPLTPQIIDNLCFMLVNTEPLEAISVKFEYKMGPEGHLLQTLTDDNDRRQALWQEDLRWYGTKIADMVGS